MAATVGQIYQAIDRIAPFETQQGWDNAGLLAGHPNRRVERVLAALDLTPGVIDEAARMDAELIITHHPVMFHGRKHLREDDPEGALLCALVRSGRSLIAAHTNFDVAAGGVNDALAAALRLSEVEELPEGLRIGRWGKTLAELCEAAGAALHAVVRPYDRGYRRLDKVAVCGGAGGGFWKIARDAGADALLTGEVRHADALAASQWGLALVEAGHRATEQPSVKAMRIALQTALDALQYSVMVFESESEPF
ncbi:Nif3-like dinuclear metal center hexameric protein [Bacillota bacterium Meth-B3]